MVEDIARLGDHALVVDRVAQAAGDAERVGQFVIELPIHAEAVVIERAREVRQARAADIFGRPRRARGELAAEQVRARMVEARSEARRAGKECVSKCISWWAECR